VNDISLRTLNNVTYRDRRCARTLNGLKARAQTYGDGIAVTLLWEPGSDSVLVAVADERTSDRFQIRVNAADALDAFHHPYAYDRRHRPLEHLVEAHA